MPLFAAAVLLAAASPPQSREAFDAEIARRWREHAAQISQTEREFRGSISGGGLDELGRLSFVFREGGVRRWRPNRLHPTDRDLATNAAVGQSSAEFERNLSAIVGYLRLTTALADARSGIRRAGSPHRADMTEIEGLAAEVDAFRSERERAVIEGRVNVSQALTRESVGRLADPELAARVLAAYRRNIRSRWRRDSVALLWTLPFLLSFGIVAAFILRLRARQSFPRIALKQSPFKL